MEFENYKPTIVMIVMQFIYAANTLFCRGALVQGLSARVFVVYRQTIGFLLIAPIAFGPRYVYILTPIPHLTPPHPGLHLLFFSKEVFSGFLSGRILIFDSNDQIIIEFSSF